jgi:hypothetical protein
MKLFRTNEGGLSLVFNKEEASDLLKQIGVGVKAVEDGGGSDKLKGLEKKTKDLISDIRLKFGNSIISRRDPVLKDLFFKHKISSPSAAIKGLEAKNIFIAVKKENGEYDSIQLVN